MNWAGLETSNRRYCVNINAFPVRYRAEKSMAIFYP